LTPRSKNTGITYSPENSRTDGSPDVVSRSTLCRVSVELAQVSQLLRQSELRLTADLYSHLQRQTATTAARHMDSLLGG